MRVSFSAWTSGLVVLAALPERHDLVDDDGAV
jgi:hypothetical protein